MQKYLIEYLKKRGYGPTESVSREAPVNYPYKGMYFVNISLIGDAAVLCSKIFGVKLYNKQLQVVKIYVRN